MFVWQPRTFGPDPPGALTTYSYSRDNVSHPTTTQTKPQAVPHQILRPCFIADLPHFPGFFLKYNRVELQYGSFSYPPSKKISLQMRALPVICHILILLGALRGVTHCPVNTSIACCCLEVQP